ncbi:MAG: diadenylate cyclase CdaA [Lachnospiraceae bacterium]|nr:diadenylate cyclase CdaA [Lachnospiraceae bacterium]
MFDRVSNFVNEYFTTFRLPEIGVLDVVEMIILAFIIYYLLSWAKNTRAWNIFKGLIIVLGFLALAMFFDMTTIIWLAKSLFTLLAVAIIVALQPEIRRFMEGIGQKNVVFSAFMFDSKVEAKFTDEELNELIQASFEMARARTGALIVFEQSTPLDEYVQTGIELDAKISSQLLVNIFEHNTPLHDGAVIISGGRIKAATCYLPLSENKSLSKELGTRHRAALGLSEASDSLIVVVSEETGKISVAHKGELVRSLEVSDLRKKLAIAQDKKDIRKKTGKKDKKSAKEKKAKK